MATISCSQLKTIFSRNIFKHVSIHLQRMKPFYIGLTEEHNLKFEMLLKPCIF